MPPTTTPQLATAVRASLLLALWLVSALLAPLHAQPAEPVADVPGDAVFFLSSDVLDRLLGAADGSEYQLTGGGGLSIRLVQVRTDFADRPGRLRAELEATVPGRATPLPLTAAGRLEAVRDDDAPGHLYLRPQLTELMPTLGGSTLDDTLRLMAAATVKAALNTLARTMPAFELPLHREFALDRTSSHHALEFRLGDAVIDAELQVPAFRLTLAVGAREPVFSQRGLFAVLDVDSAAAPADADPSLDAAALDALFPNGEDASLMIKGDTLQRLVQRVNALPPRSRSLGLRSTGARGKLMQRRRLGLGCGSSARLAGPSALRGGFHLGAVGTRWDHGQLGFELMLGVAMRAGVRVRVNGFPAPCGLTSPRPRCRCAKGKTAFTVPTTLQQGLRVTGVLGFERDSAGAASYHIDLTTPHRLQLRPRVQLGRLGSIGIPLSIKAPIGTLNRGPLPTALERRGSVALGYPPVLERHWRLRLHNTRLDADALGVSAGFDVDIDFSAEP